jgi:hypothetical protein
MLGRDHRNMLSVNARFTFQGGDRYSPINLATSLTAQDAVYNEHTPFSEQLPPALIAHFTVSYKINCEKISHEMSIKILNATGYKDFYGHRYNFHTRDVDIHREAVMIPNISYRI